MIRIAAIALLVTVGAGAQTAPAPVKKTTTTQHRTTSGTRRRVAKKPAGPPDATKFKEPVAHIHTTVGDLTCTLDPKQAPETVKNFIQLAQGTKPYTDPRTGQQVTKKPYYNGVIFHRVIPSFMVQTGDPTGTGEGGPGYKFNDELTPEMHFDKGGKLAMANSGPNTNGSQFFVTEGPTPFLDPCLEENGCQRGSRMVPKNLGYTLFGQCDDTSVALVKQIARLPRNSQDKPDTPPSITGITFTDAAAPTTAAKSATAKRAATKKTATTPKK
jgi:peptidyl-prolyl cis-trans isomerase A (cyclophilin A)